MFATFSIMLDVPHPGADGLRGHSTHPGTDVVDARAKDERDRGDRRGRDRNRCLTRVRLMRIETNFGTCSAVVS